MAPEPKPDRARRTAEIKTFLILAAVLVPLLSVVAVGGLGLVVWTYQMIAGPPGTGNTPPIVRPAVHPKS